MSKTNKFILWCVLVAVTSFWMWAGVNTWFQGSLFEIRDVTNLVILSVLFTILLILLSIGLVIFRSHFKTLVFSFVSGVTFLLIFGISNLNLVGVFILVILFYHAQDIIHNEMAERIKMNSLVLIKKGLKNFIVALFVLMSFAAYQSPAIETFKDLQELPTGTAVFVEKIAEQTLSSQLSDADPSQKDQALSQITQEIIREANLFMRPYFQYVPPALAFGLFLVLWGLGWIFIWLAVFLGIVVFWMLKRTGFFRLEIIDVKAEKIVI